MMDRDDKAPRTPISLLDYLEQRGWKKLRDNGGDEVLGLCPLHLESIPSFYVNRRKQAFYCHGCDRGGGLARLIDLLEGRPEPAEGFRPPKQLMEQTYCFYQRQLARNEACAYLTGRGIHDLEVIQRMRIGYAPGTCLRGYLTRLGYSHDAMRNRRLVDSGGRDCLFRCLTFPLPECGDLYGRSLFPHGLCRHRFLPGSKGGLYGWNQAMAFPRVMVVEGLFDAAALWQAGFPQSVAALGSHLNDRQLSELCQAGSGSPISVSMPTAMAAVNEQPGA